ncbi:MAG: mechanosensitive ion channel family protein [Desulfobacterales bacterium]
MDPSSQWTAKLTTLIQTDGPYWQAAAEALGLGLALTLVWLILRHILVAFERRGERYTFIRENRSVFRLARKSLVLVLLLIGGIALLRRWDLPLLRQIYYAVLVVICAWPVNDFVIIALRYLEKNIAARTATDIDDILFDLLNRFAGVIIYVTAIIIALDILGINVMPFVAGAGVAGVAIGFAAKDTLSNLIAGVLLIIDRPFEVGDRIEVWSAPINSATWGDVVDIGIRATKIKTTDNIVIIIPNNEIMKRDIINYTTDNNRIRVRVNFGIGYNNDIQKAKTIILDVARAIPWASRTAEPKVVVRNFGESAVELQLRIWIDEARKRMDTISRITDQVKERFHQEGIEIPYPKRDITIRQEAVEARPPAEPTSAPSES